mgnify:CR=1 FL=1
MEISGKRPSLNVNAYVQNAELRKSEEKSGTDAPLQSRKDRVDLSPRAKTVRKAALILKEMPEIREDKVADIQRRLETGAYRIDGSKIAMEMIRDAVIKDQA